MVTLIFSNSFQKLWCGSAEFTNVTSRDFVPFSEAKIPVFCFQNLFKMNFLNEKWVYNPPETQKTHFDSKKMPFLKNKAQWLSQKSLYWLTFLLLLKLKNGKDHWFRTPKFYTCIMLSVACWKFQKICRKKTYEGYIWQGCPFFLIHPVCVRWGQKWAVRPLWVGKTWWAIRYLQCKFSELWFLFECQTFVIHQWATKIWLQSTKNYYSA